MASFSVRSAKRREDSRGKRVVGKSLDQSPWKYPKLDKPKFDRCCLEFLTLSCTSRVRKNSSFNSVSILRHVDPSMHTETITSERNTFRLWLYSKTGDKKRGKAIAIENCHQIVQILDVQSNLKNKKERKKKKKRKKEKKRTEQNRYALWCTRDRWTISLVPPPVVISYKRIEMQIGPSEMPGH